MYQGRFVKAITPSGDSEYSTILMTFALHFCKRIWQHMQALMIGIIRY
jgi:hypothetical protein